MSEPSRAPGSGKRKEVGLRWTPGQKLPLSFADQLHMTRIGDQVYVTFGQTRLPVTGEGEEGFSAEIDSVASLVIPTQSLERMVQVLQSALVGSEAKE